MAADRNAPSLGWIRFKSWSAIFVERLVPLALPLVLALLLFATLSWFGFFRLVLDPVRIAVGILIAIGSLLAITKLRAMRTPSSREVDRRIETDNELIHTPLTVRKDRLADGEDDLASALWEEHKRRISASIPKLGGIKSASQMEKRDPYALRVFAPLIAATAFVFSFSPYGGSLTDVFQSNAVLNAPPLRVDAWLAPPRYTGIAPIFMTAEVNAERDTFTIPEGSIANIRLSGGVGDEVVTLGDVELAESEAQASGENATRSFEDILREGKSLIIRRGDDVISQWSIAVTDDADPTIRFADEETRLTRAANGTWTLNYFAQDDYRLRSAEAVIALNRPVEEGARPLYEAPELTLSLPRRSAENGAARTTRDLSEHPWAGAPIKLTLRAADDLDQIGESETLETTLPGRPFSNRLSRAITEQRRNLAVNANSAPDIIDALDMFTLYPEELLDNPSHFLGLSTARTRLASADSDDELRDVVDYLWEIARQIEDGNLSEAERRLRQAQEALREAIENGASDEEIAQLTEELRDAMQDFMREFAEQMQNNPQAQQSPMDQSQMQQLDQQSLDEMLDQMQELAEQGAREQALDMLSQLNQMMNNMQMGQQQQGQQGQQQSRAQEQMNELGEILREQQELMNETFRQNREQREGQRQQGQNQQSGQQGQQQPGQQQGQNGQQPGQQQGQQPGQQGQGGQQGQAQNGQGGLEGLAPGQQSLQERLDQFMQGLADMGLDPGDAFGRAQGNMEGAGEALGDGEGDAALAQQGNAMDALRQGAGEMMQQMQQQAQNGQGQGQQQAGPGNQGADDRDPLGRPQRSSGPDFGESIEIPDEIDVRRAREILEAIRRRLGNALSPTLEREYLERLLDLR
ncbi:MAG: TIGR02302 family protein [Pseudomonadota bacterium]